MTDEEFYTYAGYLCNPERYSLIEAELPERRRIGFERDYADLTNNTTLPENTDQCPYFVMPDTADKWGLELRVYFWENDNIPEGLDNIVTIQNRPGYEDYNARINHNEFIYSLFQYGFILGNEQNEARIRERIPNEFIEFFADGYNL